MAIILTCVIAIMLLLLWRDTHKKDGYYDSLNDNDRHKPIHKHKAQ